MSKSLFQILKEKRELAAKPAPKEPVTETKPPGKYSTKKPPQKIGVGKGRISAGGAKGKKISISMSMDKFRDLVKSSKCTSLTEVERARVARMLLVKKADASVMEAFKSGGYETVAKFLGKK